MIAYIRFGIVLAALGLSAWGGWAVRAWFDDSGELKRVTKERDAALDRERIAARQANDAEAARVKTSKELDAEKAKIHAEVAPIIKRIPVYIDRNNCTISPDGLRALNVARGATMPDAGGGAPNQSGDGAADSSGADIAVGRCSFDLPPK